MSPRKRRAEHRGLPTGWRWKNGAWRYMVPKSARAHWDGRTEFRLGKTLGEAYETWAARLGAIDRGEIDTMTALAADFLDRHVPMLAPKTQESYRIALRRIVAVFGPMLPGDVEQHHARGFYTALVREHGRAVARSTCGVLKTMMTFAAESPDVASVRVNVLLGMRFEGAGGAKRLLTRAELGAILSLEPRTRTERVGLAYVRLGLLTGLRRGDILRLTVTDTMHPEHLLVRPHKTENTSGVAAEFVWTTELRTAVDEALAIPPHRIGAGPLIATRVGRPYIDPHTGEANGFDSLSRRFVDATIRHGLVTDRWTMKDLRAAVGSHAETLAEARRQLLHSSEGVTDRHYRRAPERIVPISLERFRAS